MLGIPQLSLRLAVRRNVPQPRASAAALLTHLQTRFFPRKDRSGPRASSYSGCKASRLPSQTPQRDAPRGADRAEALYGTGLLPPPAHGAPRCLQRARPSAGSAASASRSYPAGRPLPNTGTCRRPAALTLIFLGAAHIRECRARAGRQHSAPLPPPVTSAPSAAPVG